MRLLRAHADFLALQRVAHVATVDARGIPHVVPVCLVVEAGRLYFASGKTGRKIANLRANPEVAVSVDEYTETWGRLRGVVVQGTATVQVGEVEHRTMPGEYRYIPLKEKHRLTNIGKDELVLIEVQCGDYLGEDDIVRLADTYGRA